MALSSKQIVDLLSKPPTQLSQGKLAYHLKDASSYKQDGPTPRQRAFIEEYSRVPVSTRQTYNHPQSGPLPRREPGPLTAAELAWLSRFPNPVDPSTVSFQDAQALAVLDDAISPLAQADESRLVRSVWAPIREHHDRAAAQVALDNARQPLPDIPHEAFGALADAIVAENDQLTPDEAAARANSMLADTRQRREAARTRDLEAVNEMAMKVDGQTYERTAVTH